MSDSQYVSRRKFLLVALASLTAACSRDDSQQPGDASGNAVAAPAWLPQIIGDPEASARLGRVYLATNPGYQRGGTLVADIEQAITRYDASAAGSRDPVRIASTLRQLVRTEYVHGEVTTVSGWVLSTTEARLYALATFP